MLTSSAVGRVWRCPGWTRRRGATAAALLSLLATALPASGAAAEARDDRAVDTVVVATLDTGTNPFHPCWRATEALAPQRVVAGYPQSARPLRLTFDRNYSRSKAGSADALASLRTGELRSIEGTRLSFYGGNDAPNELVDTYGHGGRASSQIGCADFGMAPDAHVVVLNYWQHEDNLADHMAWIAKQDWIDIVHVNIQDTPVPTGFAEGHRLVVASGKLVVNAAGNGVQGYGAAYPSFVMQYAPAGVLLAGANDNDGRRPYWANLHPHLVMDGLLTVAAADFGFGRQGNMGGTSSSSPRVTGYAARVLSDARQAIGHTGRGLLRVPPGRPRPRQGPMVDGVLTAAELHEVLRHTADPDGHASRYDGRGDPLQTVPGPGGYSTRGYGEVSEHTVAAAVDVITGRIPLPDRPAEHNEYYLSTYTQQR